MNPPPPRPSVASEAQAVRSRNPRGHGDQLRRDLLEAAADLLEERATVEGVSLRAVASRAGVSPTAVYQHFDDHAHLLTAALDHTWDRFAHALVSDVDAELPPHERFSAMGRNYFEFATNHTGSYRVLFAGAMGSGSEHGEFAFSILVDLVAEILHAGDDPRDPHFVAVQVHTWMHGMVDLVGCHPDFDWPDLDVMLEGLETALRLDGSASRA